jgi:hypothetical protein
MKYGNAALLLSAGCWLTGWVQPPSWRVALAVYPPTLRDKTAIVTGANSGIGLETTKALLQQGATVIMACRSLVRCCGTVSIPTVSHHISHPGSHKVCRLSCGQVTVVQQ